MIPPQPPLARSANPNPNPFPRNLLGNGPAQALLGGGPLRAPDAPGRSPRTSRRDTSSGGGTQRGGSGNRKGVRAEKESPRHRGGGRERDSSAKVRRRTPSPVGQRRSAPAAWPPDGNSGTDASYPQRAVPPRPTVGEPAAARNQGPTRVAAAGSRAPTQALTSARGQAPTQAYALPVVAPTGPSARRAQGLSPTRVQPPGWSQAHAPQPREGSQAHAPQPWEWPQAHAPQPQPRTVGPQPPPSTGGPEPTTSTGGAQPTPSTGGPEPTPRTGGPRSSRPRHRQIRRPRSPRIALSQPTGPHVRLGIVWAAITFAVLWQGSGWAAVWLVPIAAMAAATAMRTWGTSSVAPPLAHNRRARVQPPAAVAALFSALIAVSALGGGQVMGLVAGSAILILVGATVFGPVGRPRLIQRVLIVVGPGVAAGCLVLARSQGLATGLVLVAMVALYDSSAYLIGSGAPNRWEGSVAGAASIAALTLTVAAVLSRPFTGTSPWLFGIAAAVLAPVGVSLCRWITGDKVAPVPALRRLDSLLLLGPVWVVAVAVILHK